jgi:fibro-slime domain-containing protein
MRKAQWVMLSPLAVALHCTPSSTDGLTGTTSANGGGGFGGEATNGAAPPTGAGGEPATSGQFMDTVSSGSGGCAPVLSGIVRDFRAWNNGAGHPDFENYIGDGLKGLVSPVLGADHKPIYANAGATPHTTGPNEFNQWYRDVPSVNQSFPFAIEGTIDGNGVFTYDNSAFFPIDTLGFGNEGQPHNFGFTFELHMEFFYGGGEEFTFSGDDDLWVFINDRLAIDLGGLHPEQTDTLDVDARAAELGLVVGQTYPLDLFHAERHTDASNFRIQSSLNFSNCDPIVY